VSVAHYENFPVASRVVPKHLRGAVVAIYRFARAADDCADEGDLSAVERLAALERLSGGLDAIAAGTAPHDPLLRELAAAIADHGLPLAPFRDLLSAFAQDVSTSRYATAALLFDYCARSANPIGRLLLRLYRADTPANRAASDSVCTALQLVNFWQDIAEDWRRGRLYVPEEDLRRFGVAEGQIAEERCDAAWRALMAFETARARALLESGRPLARALPWRLSLELSGVLAGGHRILDGIDAAGGDVFRRRPQLAGADWLAVAFTALFPLRRHRVVASADASSAPPPSPPDPHVGASGRRS
jgi:squalene synthase HpnC